MFLSYWGKTKNKHGWKKKYSEFEQIISGVSQEYILDPLLFNVYICAGPFLCFSELNDDLPKDKMFKWFQNNYFKPNSEKCHFLTTS